MQGTMIFVTVVRYAFILAIFCIALISLDNPDYSVIEAIAERISKECPQ